MADRLDRRGGPPDHPFRGPRVPANRFAGVVGLFPVMGELRGILVESIGERLLECARGVRVEFTVAGAEGVVSL